MMDQQQPDSSSSPPESNGIEQFRPVRPVRPEIDGDDVSPGSKRAKSSFSIILAGGALLLGIGVLSVLMAPVGAVLFAVIGLVLFLTGLAAFHYVVWGWWLGGVIRAEVEADEQAEEEAKRRLEKYSPPDKPKLPDSE
jgi:hypothetical protein